MKDLTKYNKEDIPIFGCAGYFRLKICATSSCSKAEVNFLLQKQGSMDAQDKRVRSVSNRFWPVSVFPPTKLTRKIKRIYKQGTRNAEAKRVLISQQNAEHGYGADP